jgi:DNA-binding XRE family transcriptional regulator
MGDVAALLPPVDDRRAPTTERQVMIIMASEQERTKTEWNLAISVCPLVQNMRLVWIFWCLFSSVVHSAYRFRAIHIEKPDDRYRLVDVFLFV